MADYIDRQAAIAALREFAEGCKGSDEVATAVSVAISVLSRVPSPWMDAKAHPPEKNGEYLCCFEFTLPASGLCKEQFFGPISYYATDEPPHWNHWNSEGTHGITVLSWMPSPDLPDASEVPT